MKQTSDIRNSERNNSETSSLKSLAQKVLQRNSVRNKSETRSELVVSSIGRPETSDLSLFRDLYHERAAIFEFEGNLECAEAERRSYLEVFTEFVATHHPEIKATFEKIIHAPSLN